MYCNSGYFTRHETFLTGNSIRSCPPILNTLNTTIIRPDKEEDLQIDISIKGSVYPLQQYPTMFYIELTIPNIGSPLPTCLSVRNRI